MQLDIVSLNQLVYFHKKEINIGVEKVENKKKEELSLILTRSIVALA